MNTESLDILYDVWIDKLDNDYITLDQYLTDFLDTLELDDQLYIIGKSIGDISDNNSDIGTFSLN